MGRRAVQLAREVPPRPPSTSKRLKSPDHREAFPRFTPILAITLTPIILTTYARSCATSSAAFVVGYSTAALPSIAAAGKSARKPIVTGA